MRALAPLALCCLFIALPGCRDESPAPEKYGAKDAATAPDQAAALDGIADEYVRLSLAVGRHEPAFVDAYYGPAEWKQAAESGAARPVPQLLDEARALLGKVRQQPAGDRQRFLEKQLVAVEGFLRRLAGEKLAFAEEARLLFDIEAPRCGEDVLEPARLALEKLLPGEGDLAARTQALRAKVEIPADKLPAVADAALAEARARTAKMIALPEGERFTIAFVKDKPWGAYNWYKGNLESLIEFNTDLPATVEGVWGTLAHEGYPGHHLYNALLEERLVRGKGWREYSVYPLWSPQSLIAEGTANFGPRVITTPDERRAILDRLASIAGVNPDDLRRWEASREAAKPLDCLMGEAARRFLDEGLSEDETVRFLVRYGSSEKRARQNIAFIKQYRSYVLTYSVGEDLVAAYVGEGPDRAQRFFDLLQRPVVPSDLGAK